MKKILLGGLFIGLAAGVQAQDIITDTVITGAGYADQVWYRLSDGSESSIAKGSWDIAFSTEMMSASIITNYGTELWKQPTGDTTAWASLDTTGMTASWTLGMNAPETWEIGAFNSNPTADPFDYGWGTYNMTTHVVTGNSIFVIRLTDGSYKKIWIKSLAVNGTYTFVYANLDNTGEETVTIAKPTYSAVNFAYYDLKADDVLSLEPNKTDWDFYFTQYTELVNMGSGDIPWPVVGILTNAGVTAAKVEGVDPATYVNYGAHTLGEERNIIGYDWKTFDMNTMTYSIEDSTVYFVKDAADEIWKVVMTGFGGSANGNFIFSKEKMDAVGIEDAGRTIASVVTYPNPVIGGQFTLAYNMNQTAKNAELAVYNLAGQRIFAQSLNKQAGMHTQNINTTSWSKGVYVISVDVDGQSATQKVIVQ